MWLLNPLKWLIEIIWIEWILISQKDYTQGQGQAKGQRHSVLYWLQDGAFFKIMQIITDTVMNSDACQIWHASLNLELVNYL